jgi:GWxTD domain-containing protein
MTLKTVPAARVLLITCLSSLPAAALEDNLSRSDKRWLEEDVAAIITREEIQIFKELRSSKDRKLFKELFWVRRDPNLLTTENEFREDLERRESIAQRNFKLWRGRSSTSDMEKVYLLLGGPARESQIRQQDEVGGFRMAMDPEEEEMGFRPVPASEGPRTINWIYEPIPELGLEETLEVRFESQPGLGAWMSESDKVEEALERARNAYVMHPNIDYSVDANGRLEKLPLRLDPSSPAKKVLRTTIERGEDRTDIAFETETASFQGTEGPYVPVLFEIDPASLSWDDGAADVTVFGSIESVEGQLVDYFEEPARLVRNESGPSSFEMPFQLPHGSYTFNVGIMDERSEKAGTRRIPVFVVDFESAGPSLSSVLLYRKKTVSEESELAPGRAFQFGNAHFEPVGGRAVKPMAGLGLFFFVYGYGLDDEGRPRLSADCVFSRDGEPVERIESQPVVADASRAYADLPLDLSGFDAGQYQIEIQVSDHVTSKVMSGRVDLRLELDTLAVAEYSEVVGRYQSGERSEAIEALSRMPVRSLQGAARAYWNDSPTGEGLKVAAILHTEVAALGDVGIHTHLRLAKDFLDRIGDEPVQHRLLKLWYLALAHRLKGSPATWSAMYLMEGALETFPRDVEIQIAVGSVYEAMGWTGAAGTLELAEGLYRDVLEAEPSHGEAHLRLGRTLQLDGRSEEAIRQLEWSRDHGDDSQIEFVAHLLLGDLYFGRGTLREAARSYRAALERDPYCQQAIVGLAQALDQTGDPGRGRESVVEFFDRGSRPSGEPDRWQDYLEGSSKDIEGLLDRMRQEGRP